MSEAARRQGESAASRAAREAAENAKKKSKKEKGKLRLKEVGSGVESRTAHTKPIWLLYASFEEKAAKSPRRAW